MIDLQEFKDDYDWQEAFAYGTPQPTQGYTGSLEPFAIADVEHIYHASEGENDVSEWMVVARLRDGRFIYLEAGCDYTGWDCQAWGQTWVAEDMENLLRWGLTEEARERFNIKEDK